MQTKCSICCCAHRFALLVVVGSQRVIVRKEAVQAVQQWIGGGREQVSALLQTKKEPEWIQRG